MQQLIDLFLVARKYSELEALTNGVRLGALDIASAITKYGKNLVIPPNNAWELLDVVEIRNAQPPQWSVTMPLWTREEGRSDLSIELTLIGDEGGCTIELDDIHVL